MSVQNFSWNFSKFLKGFFVISLKNWYCRPFLKFSWNKKFLDFLNNFFDIYIFLKSGFMFQKSSPLPKNSKADIEEMEKFVKERLVITIYNLLIEHYRKDHEVV